MFYLKKEIYCGSDLQKMINIRSALEAKGIESWCKTVRSESSPPFRGNARNILGRVGERSDYATMYYIYVKKNDMNQGREIVASLK